MRLINIKLTNFRKYIDAEIDLPDGLTGILGQNGTGKSTLLEAVGWALYGPDAARTGKNEDIRRQGAGADGVCRVELTFEIGGAEYTVVREMRGKNLVSDASIKSGGEVVVRGAQPVLDQIIKIVGLDRNAFFVSFFARQKELNALSDYRPAERKTLIIKMLGIDDVDKALEMVKTDKRETEASVTGLRLRLPDTLSLQAELIGAGQNLKDTAERLKKDAAAAAGLGKKLEQAKKLFEAEDHKRLDSEDARRKKELALQNLEHLRSLSAKLSEEAKELEGIKSERDRIAPALRFAAEQELAAAAESAESAGRETARAELEAKQTAQTLDEANKEIAAGGARRSELERAVERLAGLEASLEAIGPEGVCPTCLRPLGGDLASIEAHYKKDIAGLRREIADVDKAVAEWQSKKQAVVKRVAEQDGGIALKRAAAVEAEGIVQRVSRLLDSLPESEAKEHPGLFSRAMTVVEKLAYLAQRRDEVMRTDAELKRLPALSQELKEVAAKTARTETEIKTIESADGSAFDPAVFAKAKDEFERLREEKHALELGLKDAERDKMLAEQKVAGLRENLDMSEKLAGEIKEAESRLNHLKSLDKVLGSFRKHLIGRIRPTLAEKAGELLYDLTDGKYSRLELDEDYEIYVYDEGGRFPIDRFSGGEKDLANLCLRLAISLTLADRAGSDYGFIVLDEIFGSQDTVRKMSIMRALESLNKRFRQIFLITHVEDIKDEVEHVITVTENEQAVSQATLI